MVYYLHDDKKGSIRKGVILMTNSEYCENRLFKASCKLAQVKTTTRQASKFRRGMGLAHTRKGQARIIIAAEDKANASPKS